MISVVQVTRGRVVSPGRGRSAGQVTESAPEGNRAGGSAANVMALLRTLGPTWVLRVCALMEFPAPSCENLAVCQTDEGDPSEVEFVLSRRSIP